MPEGVREGETKGKVVPRCPAASGQRSCPHRQVVCCETAAVCGLELLPHPPYSPDLAPSDLFRFPKMKEAPRGRKVSNDNAVMEAVEEFVELQTRQFFADGLAWFGQARTPLGKVCCCRRRWRLCGEVKFVSVSSKRPTCPRRTAEPPEESGFPCAHSKQNCNWFTS